MNSIYKPMIGGFYAALVAAAFFACTGGDFAGTANKKNLSLNGGKADANDGGDPDDDSILEVPVGSSKALPGIDKNNIKDCLSSDPDIVSVDPDQDCIATGQSEGKSEITVIMDDGTTVVIPVTVTPAGSDGSGDGSIDGGGDAAGGIDGGDGSGGGVDSTDSSSGGIGGGDDSTGGEDGLGGDDGEVSASLRTPLKIRLIPVPNENNPRDKIKLTVRYVSSKGDGQIHSFDIPENKPLELEAPRICNRRDDTTIALTLHYGKPKTIGNTDHVKKTGGAFNVVKITVDDGGCAIGTCVEVSSDPSLEFECPNSKYDLIIKDL